MDRPEWLTRAEMEQKDLAGKIKRLSAMLADATRMQPVTDADRSLLHHQLSAMTCYNSTLSMRIQRHGGTTCAE